jgi:hypothetical protein
LIKSYTFPPYIRPYTIHLILNVRDRTHLLVYPPIPTHIMLNVIMKEGLKSWKLLSCLIRYVLLHTYQTPIPLQSSYQETSNTYPQVIHNMCIELCITFGVSGVVGYRAMRLSGISVYDLMSLYRGYIYRNGEHLSDA